MSELDTLLESGFQEAANRETFARQIEAKIKEIPGAAALIPARRYGEPVNAEKIRASLTLRSLIEAKSPQLAVYFGLDAGVAHRRLEEKEARELLKERMQMLTEKPRAANEQAAAGQAIQQKNPGAVVSAIRQLDHMTGTGYNSHRGYGIHRRSY